MGLLGSIGDVLKDTASGALSGFVGSGFNPAGAIAGAVGGAGRGIAEETGLSGGASKPRRPGQSRSSGRGARTGRGSARRSGGQSLVRQGTPGITSTGGGPSGGFQFRSPSVGGQLNIPGIGSIGGQFTGPSVSAGGSASGDDPKPTQQVGGNMMMSFGQALGQLMLKESVKGKSGRAILEALTSGSLQNGVIQPTVTVQTPRGTENHSPPGFRTVYVNDQPYAVFKPLASELGLLDGGSLTFKQKLDKQTRKYLSNRRFIKDVAKKVGLKTSNRSSGPRR